MFARLPFDSLKEAAFQVEGCAPHHTFRSCRQRHILESLSTYPMSILQAPNRAASATADLALGTYGPVLG